MKKLLENKFVWAVGIIGIAVTVGYLGTYGNRKWLLNRLSDLDIPEETLKGYQAKSTGELRKILKEKNG